MFLPSRTAIVAEAMDYDTDLTGLGNIVTEWKSPANFCSQKINDLTAGVNEQLNNMSAS